MKMQPFRQIRFLINITRTQGILRRYFVVNGFDGALTMLGLLMGFMLSETSDLSVVMTACLGAAIALGVSGVSSAYVSERAESRHALIKLQSAMLSDMQQSAHSQAARWVPMITAFINGAAPFFISLLIVTPIFLAQIGLPLFMPPLLLAMMVALCLTFLLGVFLGRIADISWFRSGLQTLLVALFTLLLIYLIAGG
jgi:predicted membrane protein (TIGR00267 family)